MILKISILGLAATLTLFGILYILDYRAVAAGVLSGGVLSTFNLTVITFAVQKLMKPGPAYIKSLLVLIFIVKFIFLGAVIFLLVAKFHISGLGIILGITAVMTFLLGVGLIYFSQLKKEGATWQVEE